MIDKSLRLTVPGDKYVEPYDLKVNLANRRESLA